MCVSSSVWDRERSSNDNIEDILTIKMCFLCHVYIETMLMQDACSSLSKLFSSSQKLFFCAFREHFYWFSGKCNSLSMCDAWKLGRCDVNDCCFSDFHFHCGIWFFGVLFGTLEIWLNQNWIIDSIERTDWCCFHWIRGFFCVRYIECTRFCS